MTYNPQRSDGPAAGVLTYYIKDIDRTIAVMWFVRFHTPEINLWNVKVYHGERAADYAMYTEMHADNPRQGDGEDYEIYPPGSPFKISGSMTSALKAELQIRVLKI